MAQLKRIGVLGTLLITLGCHGDVAGSGSAASADFGAPAGPEPQAPPARVPDEDIGGGALDGPRPAAPGAELPRPGEPPPLVDGEGNVIEELPELEEEEEVLVNFELPAAGKRYVYAANPHNDSVAVIDSETLSVQAVEAGDAPKYVQSLGGRDEAIVLNVNSRDATIIRTRDGASRTSTVEVVAGSNAIAVAPDGRHAIVYFDAERRASGPPGSFQDLTVVLMREDGDRAVNMTVGFRPTGVAFSSSGERAFVITDDGISVLELEAIEERGSHLARTVAFGGSGEEPPRDVSITPDGRYAIARPVDSGQLRLVDLEDPAEEYRSLDLTQVFVRAARRALETAAEARSSDAGVGDAGVGDAGVTVPMVPDAGFDDTPLVHTDITDLDLSPRGDYAIAVIRGRRTVLKVPIPAAFDDFDEVTAHSVGAEIVGSVSIAPDGARALLYTTAQPENERITLFDIEQGQLRTVRLPKSVRSVTFSPDGSVALIVHQKLPGDPNQAGIDPDTSLDRSYAYSVLSLDDGFSKLEPTLAFPLATALVPSGDYLFLSFNEPGLALQEVQRVDLKSFLVDRIALGSPPISMGIVPGSHRVFVGQDHPDGRITFIDWRTVETQSVTGFELNSRIRE